MIRVDIKPLSINKAFQGRRFKTKEYINYCICASAMLPKKIDLPEPPYQIYFKFGFSNKASDWDNCVKTTQDLIAAKYSFNDKMIRRGIVETEIVPKGKEYFAFEITHYEGIY